MRNTISNYPRRNLRKNKTSNNYDKDIASPIKLKFQEQGLPEGIKSLDAWKKYVWKIVMSHEFLKKSKLENSKKYSLGY